MENRLRDNQVVFSEHLLSHHSTEPVLERYKRDSVRIKRRRYSNDNKNNNNISPVINLFNNYTKRENTKSLILEKGVNRGS